MELQILATIRKYLDDVGHAIRDGDRQTAINALIDVKRCISTLQGICELPAGCRSGLEEIWM